jgi:2-polyprenyl-6-methoxyphenol hydroxylase-like FAD-dependent oxidoreductase
MFVMNVEQTGVLVVGGSLVGLSSSLLLASHGVPAITIERHAGSSPHPRAMGFTARTLEIFRGVGLARMIPEVPPSFRLRRARVESLAGEWLGETPWTPPRAGEGRDVAFSPCTGAGIAQDRLEPILRNRAVELGADVRRSTELVRFEQDDAGVTAWLATPEGERVVRAQYMIAADGGRSAVRSALGIGTHGRGHLATMRSVLFRAPLDEYLAKGVVQFEIVQPDFAAFMTTYHDGRWVLMFSDDIERTDDELRAAIVRAVGREVPVEILARGRWELGAIVADRFSEKRVFLAGDAAHCFPPTRGGYGANTGIHDAHNLAWKLAAVIERKSRPELLDTYDAERRPVAWVRHQQLFARPDYASRANGVADGEPIRDDVAMELGQLYRSAGIIGAGDDLPVAARPDEWKGQPGTRAPHVWIERDGAKVSTLDWFVRGWTLLVDDPTWNDVDASVRVIRGAELAPARDAFGLDGGAALVRPDGVIAWRGPANAWRDALATVCFASV